MRLSDFYQIVKQRFQEAGVATPALDARLLICHALNLSHETFVMRSAELLTDGQQNAAGALIAQRLTGRPVSKIIGRKEFYGREFITTDDTLDPRPDSEVLIDGILANLGDSQAALRLLDLGTGTGCLLLTLLKELPNATGIAVDQSRAALDVAQRNAAWLGIADRAAFLHSDWLDAVSGRFDLIVSNPPYIPQSDIDTLQPEVRLFDPMAALVGGPDGLDPYRQIIPLLPHVLNPQGIAAFEVGQGQDKDVAQMLYDAGFATVSIFPDLAGINRAVIGIGLQKPDSSL